MREKEGGEGRRVWEVKGRGRLVWSEWWGVVGVRGR